MFSKERQRKRLHYFLLLLSLFLLYWMISATDSTVFLKYVSSLGFTYFIVFALVFSVAWVLRAVKLTIITKGAIRLVASFKIQLAAAAVNLIIPLKAGDLLAARYIQKAASVQYSHGLGYTLQTRVLDFLALIWILLIALLKLFWLENWRSSLLLVTGGIFLITLGVAKFSGVLQIRNEPANRLLRFLVNTYNQVLQLQKLNAYYIVPLILSLFIWVLEVMSGYWLAYQLDIPIEIEVLAVCIVVANICKAIPLLPGGLGTYEAGFLFVGSLLGIAPEYLISLSVVDHLIKKCYNLLLGFPIYMISLRGLSNDLKSKDLAKSAD